MYGFFAGDEDADGNKADVKLLLACLEGAVLTALKDGISDSALRSLAAAFSEGSVTVNIAEMPPAALKREIAERAALALLETLTGGFIDDYSAPDDLNVTLTVSSNDGSVTLHAIVRVFRLITEFFKRLFGL